MKKLWLTNKYAKGRKVFLPFILLFIIFCISINTKAQPIIKLDTTAFNLECPNLYLYIDKSNTLSLREVISKKFEACGNDSLPSYAANENYSYWLRFKLKTTHQYRWVLEYGNHATEIFQFYTPIGNRYKMTEIGRDFPFYQRKYRLSNFVFEIPDNIPEDAYFYIKIHSNYDVGFTFDLKPQHQTVNYAIGEYFILGLYYGILFLALAYNLLHYLVSKEKIHIYYVIYAAACMLINFDEDGIGFQYIWYNYPYLNKLLNMYFAPILFTVGFYLYTSTFLELKKRYPKLNTFIIIQIVSYIFIRLIGIDDTLVISILYVLPFITIYMISMKIAYKKEHGQVMYFIIGYSLVLIAVIVLRMRWYGMINSTLITVYIINIAILIEILIFSYAISQRFKMLRIEKLIAQNNLIDQLEKNRQLQEKVNRELEEKVNERTKALQEKTNELTLSNHKLENLSKEINKINEQLDYQNWQLNKKVVEEKKARILPKEIGFDEFQEIFKDDFTCLNYLANLKWQQGYSCKKCNHTNYNTLRNLQSRKCTRCNYIESALKDTLFEGTKFELPKAFYITYTVASGNTATIDELSELIGLRRITCWNFKNKVAERIKATEKKGVKISFHNWESLIKN